MKRFAIAAYMFSFTSSNAAHDPGILIAPGRFLLYGEGIVLRMSTIK